MLKVPSKGGYQFILNPAVLPLFKIGYCSMIKGSYTDFTTMYTVSMDAQMVDDVFELLDVVTTSDVAIFIQAKETKMKFSKES